MSKFPFDYKFPFFCYAGWGEEKTKNCIKNGAGFWFRIFWGYGLHFTNGRKNFSERNGYEKRLHLPFGWRAKILKPRTY